MQPPWPWRSWCPFASRPGPAPWVIGGGVAAGPGDIHGGARVALASVTLSAPILGWAATIRRGSCVGSSFSSCARTAKVLTAVLRSIGFSFPGDQGNRRNVAVLCPGSRRIQHAASRCFLGQGSSGVRVHRVSATKHHRTRQVALPWTSASGAVTASRTASLPVIAGLTTIHGRKRFLFCFIRRESLQLLDRRRETQSFRPYQSNRFLARRCSRIRIVASPDVTLTSAKTSSSALERVKLRPTSLTQGCSIRSTLTPTFWLVNDLK